MRPDRDRIRICFAHPGHELFCLGQAIAGVAACPANAGSMAFGAFRPTCSPDIRGGMLRRLRPQSRGGVDETEWCALLGGACVAFMPCGRTAGRRRFGADAGTEGACAGSVAGPGPLARRPAAGLDHALALSGRLRALVRSRPAETLRGLCPGRDEAVWTLLRADQDIVLEPTVGGKSGVEARVSCRLIESGRS